MTEPLGYIVGAIRIRNDEGRLIQIGPVYRDRVNAYSDCQLAKPYLENLEVLALTRTEAVNV